MAAGTSPIFVDSREVQCVQIANADGTTLKTLFTAGADGSRVMAVNASTDDTAANVVGLYVQIAGAGTNFPLGVKSVAARSGDPTNAAAVAAVNVLDLAAIPSLDPDGSLALGPGDVLKAGVQAAVTAAKTLTLCAIAGDY